jgi:transcriptional regulator with XRE-family HTH domain
VSSPFLKIFFGGGVVAFADNIKRIRTNKGFKQSEVAAAMGVSVIQYQNYEYGKHEPTLKHLVALADYFEVSLDYLVGRSEVPERR